MEDVGMARRGVMKKIREDGWSRQEKGGGEPAGQPASQPLRGGRREETDGEDKRRCGRTESNSSNRNGNRSRSSSTNSANTTNDNDKVTNRNNTINTSNHTCDNK